MTELTSSTPNLEEFDPTHIPWQLEFIRHVRNFDYSQGLLEILLSGSFGSAKSIVMAHVGLTHLTLFPGARLGLFRKALTDLKDTIWLKFKEHMEGVYIEGYHYGANDNMASMEFWNGSSIVSRSWVDKKYKKLRSLEYSSGIIEELTENSSQEFNAFYKELKPRMGRLPHVREKFLISATNPDAPSHAAYDHFFRDHPLRKVFLSRTDQNPFLPKDYIETIKEDYTPQEIRRYIYGEWIEITTEVIYYAYDPSISDVLRNYAIKQLFPIYISFDFNIGENKPMSATLSQYINGNFFFFDEIVIQSARTLDVLEEINARSYLDYNSNYVIHGDATGRRRDTRSIHSDYEIITKYLSNLENKYGKIRFAVDVGQSNPPIRTRHSIVNGALKNSYNKTHVYLDSTKCKMLDKGLKSTKLKKGGNYIEDDSDPWQHITTSAGYHICSIKMNEGDSGRRFIKRKI